MALITINTPFNIDLEFKVASFPKRVAAWIIDMVIITIYYYIVEVYIVETHTFQNVLHSVSIIFEIIPVMLYQLLFEIFFNGQTLGKKATGIKIIDKEGNEPSWGQFIIRWMLCFGNLFVFILPAIIIAMPVAILGFMFFYVPDLIVMLINQKSQRIGDLAAGTVVIDADYSTNINETIYQHIEVIDYVPVFPQVMRLTDRDINGIRNLLDIKKPGTDTQVYVKQVVMKIKKVLNLETEMEGMEFLQQLLLDYNFLAGK